MLKKLQYLLFSTKLSFIGFCTGMLIAMALVPKDLGMAAPASALLYGVAGLIAGLVLSFILARKLPPRAFRVTFLIAGVVAVCFLIWIIYRVQTIKKQNEVTINVQQPASGSKNYLAHNFHDQNTVVPLGVGMAAPAIEDKKVIRFCNYFPANDPMQEIAVIDSLTFIMGEHFIDIGYAPPWFVPEVLKLDYDMLYFRVVTLTPEWLEVVGNQLTGQTVWISRKDANYIDWTTFLLSATAIDIKDPATNPLRLKPLDHASILSIDADKFLLKPLAIRKDWMMVSVNDFDGNVVSSGWIRWRKGDELIIMYALLC